ncbi:MAG: hypothetical protein Q8N99_03215 [Nanoarchaeota archaeon]|nr:hypothetical protein [Nanoarchaeota archaeon]
MSYKNISYQMRDDIDRQLEDACRGTQLDPRTPDSPYMPVLHGELLTRFLNNLNRFQEESRSVELLVG